MNLILLLKTLATNGVKNPQTTVLGGSPLLLVVAYQQFMVNNPELHLPWHDWFWYVGLALAVLGWICPDWKKRVHLEELETLVSNPPATATTEDVDRSRISSATGGADLSKAETKRCLTADDADKTEIQKP